MLWENRLDETILMSTNNIGFKAEITKLWCQYPSLSRPLSEGDTSFSFNIDEYKFSINDKTLNCASA